ncbi:MAG: PAC2 family protein, partial [Halobacteriota archaeon]
EDLDARRIVAMGGVPTGELIEEYEVLAVASDADLLDALVDAGAAVRPDEPAGGIIGVSGLLLGLGSRRGFDTACLMGETSGYLVDPKSATKLLGVLEAWLGFEVDTGSLDDRAEEMEEVIGRIQEMEAQPQFDVPSDEDLRYIG